MPDSPKQTLFDSRDGHDAFFESNGWRILLFLMLCISVFVYREYLFFQRAYLFTRFSSDTLTQSFPELFFRSKTLLSGKCPFWSFQFELGMNIFRLMANYNPFDILIVLGGQDNIPYLIPYVAMLKLLSAGLLFFAFLRKLKISAYACIIGALMYAFSGYMVINGHWYHYQNYAVFAALMLLLFERWFQDGKWLLLVLALGFVCLKSFFQIYQFALFFFLYALFRLIMTSKGGIWKMSAFYTKFGMLYILGVGMGAFFFLPDAYYVSTSARGGGALTHFSILDWITKIFNTSSPWIYARTTVFSRFFSNDLLGSWEHFRGHNYLEVPASYIGLIGLIIIPTLFVGNKNKAEKRAFMFVLGVCAIYFIFPIVRTIGNAFASPTYKHTIMYVSILLIILSSYAVDAFFSINAALKTRAALIATLLLIFMLAGWRVAFGALGIHIIDNRILIQVIGFLIIYGMGFFIIRHRGSVKSMKGALLLIVVIELAVSARTTVSRNLHSSIDSDFIEKGEIYFEADTLNALKFIRSNDNGFYRIEGDKISRNAAIVQGFYGTRGYLGFVRPGIVDFNQTMRLSLKSPRLASYREGLDRRNRLHTLLSVKYFLARNPKMVPPGYEFWRSFGTLKVYKNKYFLPLGYSYIDYIDRPTFDSLPVGMKDAVFLKAFVSDKDYPGLERIDDPRIVQSVPVQLTKNMFSTYDLRITSGTFPDAVSCVTANNDPQFSIDLGRVRVMDGVRVRLFIESQGFNIGQVFWKGSAFTAEHSKWFLIKPGRHEYVVLVDRPAVETLRIDLGDKPGWKMKIDDLKLFNVRLSQQRKDWDTMAIDVARRRHETLSITRFEEDHIWGEIRLPQTRMLFLGIPFDKGWQARVNGKDVNIDPVNIGFMGILLEKGTNRIELTYIPPYLLAGGVVSIISLMTCLLLYYKKPLIVAFGSRQDIASRSG